MQFVGCCRGMAKDNNNINIADELSSSGSGSTSTAAGGSSSADALKYQGNSRTTTTDQQQQQLNYGSSSRGRTNGVLVGSHPDAVQSSSDLQHQQQQHSSALGQRSTGNSTNAGPVDSETGGMNRAIPELPRREENPFSFKHFLKRDSSLGSSASTSGITANGTNINHSRSTSNINGNNHTGSSSFNSMNSSNNLINNNVGTSSSNNSILNSSTGNSNASASPSKRS